MNISVSLNPRPPKYFGFVIFSHATQHVLLFLSLLPHEKLPKRPQFADINPSTNGSKPYNMLIFLELLA
jgi:hypothetical protein